MTLPPHGDAGNRAPVLLVSTLMPAAFIGVALSATAAQIVLVRILDGAFDGNPPQHAVVAAIVVPLAVLGLTAVFTVPWLRNWLTCRAIAVTPAECWLAEPPRRA